LPSNTAFEVASQARVICFLSLCPSRCARLKVTGEDRHPPARPRPRGARHSPAIRNTCPRKVTRGGFISFFSDLLGLALSSGPDGPQDQSYQEPSHSRDKKGWRQNLLPGVRHGQAPWASDLLLDISQEQATWVGDPQVVPDRHETVPYLRVSLSPDCDCTGGPARQVGEQEDVRNYPSEDGNECPHHLSMS
jgi:hypothetical protein